MSFGGAGQSGGGGSGSISDPLTIGTINATTVNATTLSGDGSGVTGVMASVANPLVDASSNPSLDYQNRQAMTASNVVTFDWAAGQLNTAGGNASIDYSTKVMYDNSSNVVLDWLNSRTLDNSGQNSIDWQNRKVYAVINAANILKLDYQNYKGVRQ